MSLIYVFWNVSLSQIQKIIEYVLLKVEHLKQKTVLIFGTSLTLGNTDELCLTKDIELI